MALEWFALALISSCAIELTGSVAAVDSALSVLPMTRECNVTLREPGVVAVPEVTRGSHVVGGPLRYSMIYLGQDGREDFILGHCIVSACLYRVAHLVG